MAKARTKQQLILENEELRARLQELEETLEAIRSGAVDAIVASSPAGDRVYTLEGADHAYHTMVESMNEGAVTILTDGTILYGNGRFGQMTGASPSAIVGRPFHDFVPASDRWTLDGFIRQALSGGLKAEMRLRHESAAEIPVQISATPIDLGGTGALALVVTDLSERRRYEEIVAAEKLSRRILEQAQEAIAVCIDGCIVRANRALHEICGCIPLMQNFDQVFSLRMSESQTFTIAIPESGKTIQDQEVRYERPDGRIFDLILSAGPLFGKENKVLGTLISLVDVTERKRAAEAVQQQAQLLDLSYDAIFVWDLDGGIEYWNEGAEKLYGYSRVEAVGHISHELLGTRHPISLDELKEVLKRDGVWSGELSQKPKDGHKIVIESRHQLIHRDGRLIVLETNLDITERKRAEEEIARLNRELQQRVQELEAVFETAPIGLSIAEDPEGRCIRGNPANEKMLGVMHGAQLSKQPASDPGPAPYRALQDGRELAVEELPMQRAVRGERVSGQIVDVVRADGRTVRLYSNASPLLDEQGRPRGAVGAFLDITELTDAQEALRESEERYRSLVDTAPDAIIVHRDGWFLFANEAALRLYGADDFEQLKSRSITELLHPDDREIALKRIAMVQAGGRTPLRESRLRKLNGQEVAIEATAAPINYGGQPAVQVILRDITLRKRAEEALRESEERYRGVVQNTTAVILRLDPQGIIRFANERALQFFGYSAEELIGKRAVGTIVPERENTGRDLAAMVDGIAENPDRYHSNSNENIRKNGERVWMEWTNSGIYDREGRLKEFLSVGIDATARKLAEEALRASEEKYRNLFLNMAEEVQFWQLVRDEAGRIKTWRLVDANPPTLKTWGKQTVDEIKGKTTDEIFGPGATEHYMPVVQEILTEGVPCSYEDYFPHLDKYFRVTSVPLGDHFITTGADITGIKKAEEALNESRQRLAVIVDSIADGFYALDRSWRFAHVNDAALRHMGKTREEILGRTLFDVYPGSRGSLIETEYARAMESGEPRHFENPSLITGRVLEIHAYPGSEILTVLFRDVTEQTLLATALRESEESLRLANEHLEQRVRERTMDLQILAGELERSRHELRNLVSELVLAEERERKRIAGVLHDEIAQTLAAARMRLDLLQGTPSDQKDRHTLQEVKAFLVQSIQETRALMSDVGNPLLFDMGLKAACESLAEQMMKRHTVRILCDIRDAFKDLDPDVKTILYQVVRELLNNVVKHSRALNAQVLIDMEDGHFQVKVTDDGVGFDPRTLGAPSDEGGFGLYSIRERLLAIDGSLGIISSPETGTVVTATVPAAMK
jgi:PAS domain S-box-containing protein